jgi:hypothetical protein
MHRLAISDEVFLKLRSLRQSGGQSEDQILRNLLNVKSLQGAGNPDDSVLNRAPEGFEDATYGIIFAEGFKIFRTYKGRPYTARVCGGRWRLDGDRVSHDSLNQLSQAVIDGNENAWMFWFFKAPDGTPRRIAELRDPELVQKRPRKKRPPRRGKAAETQAPVPVSAEVEPATPVLSTTPFPASPRPQPAPQREPQPGRGGKPWEPPP